MAKQFLHCIALTIVHLNRFATRKAGRSYSNRAVGVLFRYAVLVPNLSQLRYFSRSFSKPVVSAQRIKAGNAKLEHLQHRGCNGAQVVNKRALIQERHYPPPKLLLWAFVESVKVIVCTVSKLFSQYLQPNVITCGRFTSRSSAS